MAIKKVIFTLFGHLCVALGVAGIFLPVLPTTPFLLLAAFFYIRGSRRFYKWLVTHAHLGPFISNYRKKKGIPLRSKIIAITMLWLTIGSTVIFFVPIIWVKIALLLIAAAVTVHLLSFKTL
jgi:uncharacterized protein